MAQVVKVKVILGSIPQVTPSVKFRYYVKEKEMDEMINQLVEKTGIDKATAEKVANFLKEHATEIAKWLGQAGVMDKLPGGLGSMFGGKKD